MQAKTRSAPRMPSPWSRSIQSPTRLGSSPKDFAPVADRRVVRSRAADEVDAGGKSGESCARRRPGRSVAIGQEPVMSNRRVSSQLECFPAFCCLVGKNDRADAVFFENSATFRKRFSHCFFKKYPVLRTPIESLSLVLNVSRFFGESGFAESNGSRNKGWSHKVRFSQTMKKSERSE